MCVCAILFALIGFDVFWMIFEDSRSISRTFFLAEKRVYAIKLKEFLDFSYFTASSCCHNVLK